MTFSYQKQDDFEDAAKALNVGSAVYNLLGKDEKPPEVGEIISEYANSYTSQIQQCVDDNINKYQSPFYIVVLHKKEFWAQNVLRNWFIARQSKPTVKSMWDLFPNFMHTVYEIDNRGCKCDLLWSIPSRQEAKVIIQNWDLYDPQLVKWCHQAFCASDAL